jgi:hypothetical protein
MKGAFEYPINRWSGLNDRQSEDLIVHDEGIFYIAGCILGVGI